MTAAHAEPERVPVHRLIHESRTVLGLVESGHRVEITRRGKVIAVIVPPDPDEAAIEELVAAGHVAPDWRERQTTLRRRLRDLPVRTMPAGEPVGSAAILADREETGDR